MWRQRWTLLQEHHQLRGSAGVWYVQHDGKDADKVQVPDSREVPDLTLDLLKLLMSCRAISMPLVEDERVDLPWLDG